MDDIKKSYAYFIFGMILIGLALDVLVYTHFIYSILTPIQPSDLSTLSLPIIANNLNFLFFSTLILLFSIFVLANYGGEDNIYNGVLKVTIGLLILLPVLLYSNISFLPVVAKLTTVQIVFSIIFILSGILEIFRDKINQFLAKAIPNLKF